MPAAYNYPSGFNFKNRIFGFPCSLRSDVHFRLLHPFFVDRNCHNCMVAFLLRFSSTFLSSTTIVVTFFALLRSRCGSSCFWLSIDKDVNSGVCRLPEGVGAYCLCLSVCKELPHWILDTGQFRQR